MAGVKGRSGSKTGKMPPEAVANFKAEAWDGETLVDKARRYPCHAKTLCDIRSGKIWPDIKPARCADKSKVWHPLQTSQ